MNTRFRDRLSFCSAIAMGLGVSTGYPLGIIAAAGMPFACFATETRKAAFKAAFGYYVAALWPMVPGLDRYIGRSTTLLIPLAIWVFTAILLSTPWTTAWTSERTQLLWRAPLALLASTIPPLGIIGIASPLTAAGYLFPGTGWTGAAIVAALPGIFLSTQPLCLRRRWVVLVVGICIGFAIEGRFFLADHADPPRGWIAVNTHFGDVSQPFRDFPAAQFIQQKAAETSAHVLIFPESVVPRWSPATQAFWRQSLDRCRTRGQILAIGAGLPAKAGRSINDREELSKLRSYDFSAAIVALKKMDTGRAIHGSAFSNDLVKSLPEPINNTMLVVGAESATYYQRLPVPVGMWRPFSRASVPLRLDGPGVLVIDHQRAAVLICYEQLLTFPILVSMLQRPTVIVGISNTFWIDGTPIPRYQATALRGWARLFHLPYFLAVNS